MRKNCKTPDSKQIKDSFKNQAYVGLYLHFQKEILYSTPITISRSQSFIFYVINSEYLIIIAIKVDV